MDCARLRAWCSMKDDTEANEVMESGNEFHSVIVLAAKDFWNWVEAQRGILSLCLLVEGDLWCDENANVFCVACCRAA